MLPNLGCLVHHVSRRHAEAEKDVEGQPALFQINPNNTTWKPQPSTHNPDTKTLNTRKPSPTP